MPGPYELDDEDPMADYEPDAGAQDSAAGLDDVDPMADYEGEPDIIAEAQAEVGDLGDLSLGALDGLLFNMGDELGSLGVGMVNRLDPRAPPNGQAGGVYPIEDALKTQRGQQGQIGGNVVGGVGLGLATGGLGGIGTQAAIQGTAGAVSGYGREHDLTDAAIGGTLGGVLGGGGRYVAGKLAPGVHALDDVAPRVHQAADEYAQPLLAGELQSSAGFVDDAIEAAPSMPWHEGPQAGLSSAEMGLIGELGKRALGAFGGNPLTSPGRWGASKLIGKLMSGPQKMGTMARPDPAAVKAIMATVSGNSAFARSRAAPDLATVTWALQSVNASGDTGLPEGAQATLDDALASGNDDHVASAYMQLSMSNPGFQRRMQREIEAINNEDG